MNKILSIFKHRFIKSSFIVLIGSAIISVVNYVFNLVMGRMLEPVEFSEVVSLLALAVITGVPSATLAKLMTKYTAEYEAKGQTNLINSLDRFITRYSLAIGLIMLLIFWILIPFLSLFLKIEKLPLFIFSLIFPISFIAASNRGTLHGLQKFIPLSVTGIISVTLKLILAILFIILGFSVSGVMLALIIGVFASYLYGFIKVKSYFRLVQKKDAKVQVDWKDIRSYGSIIFWTSLLLALSLSIDVILAKHFLSPDLAGQYSALSILGKIVLYGSGVFVTVMFPMVSASHTNKDGKEKEILKISLGIVTVVSILVLALFTVFPEFVIKMLFGVKYLSVAPYLGWFGLAMVFYTLATLFVNYFMAAHEKKFVYPFACTVFLQVVLIVLFHQNILAITMSMLAASFLMLVSMVVVYRFGRLKSSEPSAKAG